MRRAEDWNWMELEVRVRDLVEKEGVKALMEAAPKRAVPRAAA